MKLIIITLLLLPMLLAGQNFLDPKQPLTFEFKDPNTGILITDSLKEEFFPSDLILGWQWGDNARINEAMYMNMGQSTNWINEIKKQYSNNPTTDYVSKAMVGLTVYNPLDANVIVLEPTLKLNNPGSYEVSDNAIFGFESVSGTIPNSADPNFGRLILKSDSLNIYPSDSVILKNAWELSEFDPRGYDDKDLSGKTFEDFINKGYEYYITINLRRLDSTSTATKTGDTVLTIRIPYKYKTEDGGGIIELSRNAVIASRPILDSIIRIDSSDFRGYTYANEFYDAPQRDSFIAITDVMLPNANDTLGKDITISFFFPMSHRAHFNPIYGSNNEEIYNHQLNKPRYVPDLERAYDIDVQVKYHGNTDVAINYIRFENPSSKNVFEGKWDDRMQDGQQQLLNHFDTVDNYTFSRVYTEGGDDGRIITRWGIQRYMSKLFNKNIIASMPPINPEIWDYYVEARERWIPARAMRFFGGELAAPYFRQQIHIPSWWHNSTWESRFDTTYGFGFDVSYRGYEGNWGETTGNHYFDTLRSDYELNSLSYRDKDGWTYHRLEDDEYDFLDSLRNMDNETFIPFIKRTKGFLFAAEYAMGGITYQNSAYLFSDKPWYGQLFIDSRWDLNYYESLNSWLSIRDWNRALTPEEISAMVWGNIILGAKGFIYDRMNSYNFFPDSSEGISARINYKNNKLKLRLGIITGGSDYDVLCSGLKGDELLDCLELGGDFLTHNGSTNIDDYIDFESLAYYLSVPENRIYIGLRSNRKKMAEIHQFMMENEDEIMDMRFIGSYAKGIKTNYAQNIYFTDSLLIKNIIDIDTNLLYTKRLFQRYPTESNLIDPQDSTFFDISLLKNKDISIDSIFYIGVFNRRTDPRIRYQEGSEDYMKFLSNAEFKDSCTIGTDTSLYQSYWWKRLGARELNIPFNYSGSNGDYNLLRITELGSGNVSLDTMWHRGEKYYDMVTDTVIGQDRSLSVRLLPGEGKILKVQVLKPDIVEGFLDNYNQTNLIGYPDPLDTNMITYHLAFYKNSLRPTDSTVYKEVHYIQSLPIEKNSSNENIKWNSFSRRNLSRDFLESFEDTNYVDCNHPALVVRNDSLGNPFAYVVYTCKDSVAGLTKPARIVEAVIDVSTNIVTSNIEIYKLSTPDIEKQGTPTINASANGNFIAWSDVSKGLLLGFHKPEAVAPTRMDTIRNFDFNPLCLGTMLYPSFNTYSHIDVGEDNAGLVWYQVCPDNSKGIYYSRVSFDDFLGVIKTNVPNTYEGYFSFIYSPFQSMIKVDNVSMETKPIIYRNLVPYSLSSPPYCTFNRVDNINWIDKNNESIFFAPTMIKGITLYHRDTNNVNIKWKSSRYRKILFSSPDNTANIESINSAQQDGLLIDTSYVLAGGDYNLDYTVDNAQIYQIPSNNGSVNFSTNGSGVWDVNYKHNAARRASEGKNVQLAKTPKPNFSLHGEMWKNRRVFETSDEDSLGNPIIKTSANLFYKTYANEVVNHGFFGFTGDSNNVYFDLPKLEGDFGEVSSLNVQFETIDSFDPCKIIFAPDNSKDTILTKGILFSDYDNDGDMEMQISMFGHKNTDVKVILERVLDSTQVELTMPTITSFPNNSTKLIYSIIDSLNSEFKLIYINNDTTAHFNERSYFGGLESNDTISYKSAIQKDPVKYIIDFNNGGIQYKANNTNDFDLTVYPNPTSGNLRVQAFLPEKLDGYKISNRSLIVTIYDATGRKVLSQYGATGQMFDFDLSNSPAGAYIINVEHSEGNKKYMATERIVKE